MKTSASKNNKDDSGKVILLSGLRHERLKADSVSELDAWLLERLKRLEARFHGFVTPNSYTKSVGR